MLANHHAPASGDSPEGDSDYDIILAALMESARGRAFLSEYAMRSRAADTANLLTAIGRIESLLLTRSLEAAEASAADSGAPLSEPDENLEGPDEGPDIETAAADILEMEPAADLLKTVTVVACAAVTENAADTAATPAPETANAEPVAIDLDTTGIVMSEQPVRHASAIEFLGPDPVAAATAPGQPAQQAARAAQAPDDPFADICALSEEEKLALFA